MALVSVTLLTCGFLVSSGVDADAGPSVPAPTLSITETVQGRQLAVATATGSWRVAQPGKSAALQVSGLNPPAGQTTIVASWTSYAWRPQKGVAVSATWGVTEDGAAVGSNGGTWSIQMRIRYGFRRWSAWTGANAPFSPDIPHVVTYSAAPGRSWTEFRVRPKSKVQFEFRVQYTATAAGHHTADIAVTTGK